MKKLILILGIGLICAANAQAFDNPEWDLVYDLGSDGVGSLSDIGCGNVNWGGPIIETVYADYVAVDGNNSSYPGGHFGKQDLGLGLNRYGPWSFEMVVSTPEGLYFMPTMGSNWPIFNGIRNSAGSYYQVTSHVGSYNNPGMDLTPAGYDGTQLHTYTVSQPGGGAAADVFIDGVFVTQVSWGAGARNDNYDFYCRLFDGILNVYELKFADTYIDEDVFPYIVVNPTSVTVTENGSAATFTVVMTEDPNVLVTVLVDPNDNYNVTDYFLDSEAPGDPVTLSFTPSNWNILQTVTVTAVNDPDTEDLTEQGLINLISSCTDPNYVGAKQVTVTIVDNDQAFLDIIESGDSTDVVEGGASDSFTVKLHLQPTDTVTVEITDIEVDPNQVKVNGADITTLTFTTSNWNTAQTVTVTAIDDDGAEPDPHSADLAFAVTQTGGSQEYDGLSVPNLSVSIGENDCGMGPFDPFDVSGPEGVPDCIISFYDLAAFADKWLSCSLPNTPGCNSLDVGSNKQLFIDEMFFEEFSGVTITMNPAFKTGETNLQREEPWESATLNWFNVMEDDGIYKMWYECYDIPGWPTSDDTSFCYATSTDGINWTRPNLGMFEYQGSTENNILFRQIGPPEGHSRVHGTGVFKDPMASSERRYKAVGQGIWTASAHTITGMYSPDGLNWTRYPAPICNLFADSQYSGFWDNSLHKYVIYGRAFGGTGRSLGRSESNNFASFDPLTLIMQADENDPPNSDLYNSAALKYPYAPNIYFMFISLFQHDINKIDIRLAVSRDGVNWSRPDQDTPFIPNGTEGSYDAGTIYMGQGIIKVGDELWQYYGGSPLGHDGWELEDLILPGNGRNYSRVITRLDGYVSADAGTQTGYFITPTMLYAGDELQLNVKVNPGGSVRVGLLDENDNPIAGRSIADCVPITGDDVAWTVNWNSGSDVSARDGMPTKMKVEITDASLYAFQFVQN
ncbi:MAG: hypothetical protein JXD22_01705 [Sedimentisphaerales bacterium]|nr:hypothetical protein [Sedimentisphaerales bacterium]